MALPTRHSKASSLRPLGFVDSGFQVQAGDKVQSARESGTLCLSGNSGLWRRERANDARVSASGLRTTRG